MKFDSIVFDLDGTLWDTTPVVAGAWNTVISRNNISFREITTQDVREVTGMPHDECIRLTFAGTPDDQMQTLIDETATEDNVQIARGGAVLYEGVEEGLRRLRERYRLFIVSNCQSGYVEMFYQLWGFGDLFEDFECFGNTGESKAKNLAAVIRRNGLQRPLMVGDTAGDEAAARACGIPFAFVDYGFGTAHSPDLTHRSFGELVASLTS